ncbi:MAG: DUF3298 domain-containing protein [Paludibacteraceae bacterium]|nr:DUF3298 domain-containing protein [Paludibacteraceae bacterium]
MKKLFGIFFAILLVACSSKNNSISLNDTLENQENNITLHFEGDLNFSNPNINKETEKILRDSIISTIFGNDFTKFSNNKLLKEYAQSSLNTFIKTTEDSAKKIKLYTKIDGNIISANNQYVSFRRIITTNTTTDAKTLMTTCNHYLFDAQTGRHLNERDIFTPLQMNIIRSLLVDRAKEMAKENEIKIDFQRVRPNGNFTLTDSTITYTFNPYEIAHPRIGYIEITINNIKTN